MKTNFSKIDQCFGTTYIRHVNGLYLSICDNILCLSKERFLWRIEIFEDDRFYIKEISGHDNAEYWDKTLKMAVDSGYTEQHWRLYRNNKGLIIIEHVDSNLMLCSTDDNKLIASNEIINNENYYFTFEEESLTIGKPYIEINSNTDKISLRVEPKILSITNEEWLKNYVNKLEKAVFSYARLVGFMAFPKIEFRCYTNCNSWGYIYYGKPVVHINNNDFYNDIIRLRKVKNKDISFGALHEISHLFDKYYWIFDGEATANIKLPYVLHELGYVTELSDRLITYENYVDELYNEHGRLDNVKGLFCSSLAAKMTEIAKEIGWEVYSNVFKNFPEHNNESYFFRFELFVNKLSEYSNKDIRSMFSELEWKSIENNLSK